MYCYRIRVANIGTSIICQLLVDSHYVSWILGHRWYPEIQSACLPVRARVAEIKSTFNCVSFMLAQFQKRRQLRQKKKHKENQLKRRAEKG